MSMSCESTSLKKSSGDS